MTGYPVHTYKLNYTSMFYSKLQLDMIISDTFSCSRNNIARNNIYNKTKKKNCIQICQNQWNKFGDFFSPFSKRNIAHRVLWCGAYE